MVVATEIVDIRCPACNKILVRGFEGVRLQTFCKLCKLEFKLARRPAKV
jgi:phage FluMu protein Com